MMVVAAGPFSARMLAEVQARMWDVWCSGQGMDVAAAAVGVDRKTVFHRIVEVGGLRPRRVVGSSSRLSFEDRVHVEVALAQGRSMRAIAADLGRAPSTISREVARGRDGRGRYRAKRAHAVAFAAAARPQPRKIDANPRLRARVVADLTGRRRLSPEQIAGRLRRDFPDEPEMWVHPETIYRWIYLQPRGELKRQVTGALRTGRARRVPNAHASPDGRGRIIDMVSIHDRPAVDLPDGTRIPGHWEGDLIIGANNASAIGTIVERATGYLLLLHLPNGRGVEDVTAALIARLRELPEHLRKSLTWDQGKELAHHRQVAVEAGIEIYFADPRTPWHRPSNENTNGLLRQYFPKGTDLSVHTAADLAEVEAAMNARPRKRLDYAQPDELMPRLILGA